jgi:hypothetical protein
MAPPNVINRKVFEEFLEVDGGESRNISKDMVLLYFSQAQDLFQSMPAKLYVCL